MMNIGNDRKSSSYYGGLNGGGRSFGPAGCQVVSEGRRCGETKTLQIIQEFKNMYEAKMKQIDAEAGGDCVQAKMNLQQDWIRDLTEQNGMLVRVVEELEVEAAERVMMLEEKLQQSSKCACEVMESYKDFSVTLLEDFQKMELMQNDVRNLLELIKRAKRDGQWHFEDLKFHSFSLEEELRQEKDDIVNVWPDSEDVVTAEQLDKCLKDKNKKIKELEEKLSRVLDDGDDLSVEGRMETKCLPQQYCDLKKSMLDMREALTAEVANKHDTILSLRREVQMLEEQCRKADQQTHFKDDIIKELRKEMKQLKQQKCASCEEYGIRVHALEEENRDLKDAIALAKSELADIQRRADQYVNERDGYKMQHEESLSLIESLQKENDVSRERLKILQEEKDESLDSFQSALMSELEVYEKKHRGSIEKIERLRSELEKAKSEHGNSMKQILSLNDENRSQSELIDELQAELKRKSAKPKTSNACVEAAVQYKNASCSTPSTCPSKKDKAVDNVPETRVAGTSMGLLESQIIPTKADVALEAVPRNVSQRTSIGALESLIVATRVKPNLAAPAKKMQDVCPNTESSSKPCRCVCTCVGTSTDEDRKKSPRRKSTGSNEMSSVSLQFPEEERTKSRSRARSHSPFVASLDVYEPCQLLCARDTPTKSKCCGPCGNESFDNKLVPIIATRHSRKSRSKERTGAPCETRIEKRGQEVLDVYSPYVTDGHYTEIRQRQESTSHIPCGAFCGGLSRRDRSRSRGKDGTFVKPVSKSPVHSPDRLFDTTTVTTSFTTDYQAEGLETITKTDAMDIIEVMGPQLLDVVGIDSYNRVLIPNMPRSNFIGTSSSEEIQQIVQIEILDKVTNDQRGRFTSQAPDVLQPYDSFDEESSEYSPRDQVMLKDDSLNTAFVWDNSSSKSNNSAYSSYDADSGRPKATPTATSPSGVQTRSSMLKPAVKHTTRSRDRSSATDELQTVVNDLNESVSRMMMKSPNEKASRQRIAQLEEQLRVAMKQKERDVETERRKRGQEVENLKLTIKEMEKAMSNSQEKAQNLQRAVDLNVNTVNVLEASEERWKIEVAQQRLTIVNLQEALVATKYRLEELQNKSGQDIREKQDFINILEINLEETEKQYVHYYNQFINASETVEFLRDANLDLEVENFNLVQDLSVLEARLMKYQQIVRTKEETEGNTLQQENAALTSMVHELEAYAKSLQGQLDVSETDLIREKKISQVQSDRIEELQEIIGGKNIDINRYNDAYQDVKTKLEVSVARNRALEDSVKELQEHFNNTEMEQMIREEANDICHGELDMCLNSLQDVKFKLRKQQQTLNKKIQECAALEADFKVQSNNAEIYKKDLDNTRIRCRDEAIELKRTIRELKEKLQVWENKTEILNEEVKQSQAMLVESAQRETKQQQEYSTREQELTEKIHSSQAEEMRLLDLVTQLEQQLSNTRNDLVIREQQLEVAKANAMKMRTENNAKVNLAQEEINTLKNEINAMIQRHGKLKTENEKLQEQVSRLKNGAHLFEQRNLAIKQRLDECLGEIAALQSDKHYLEQRNAQVCLEMKCLQDLLQGKTEAVVTLEMQLVEIKANQEEICNESRNVVNNVRAWLEEQKLINQQLREKLLKKNAIIAKLQKEKQLSNCCGGCTGKPPVAARQRGGSLGSQVFPTNSSPPPAYATNWNLGSHGSGSQSPNSSVSSGQTDWYEYEDPEYSANVGAGPQLWIHRVESMTQELQRSNKYWKKKINENEFMVTKDT